MGAEWINRRKDKKQNEKETILGEATREKLAAQVIKADGPVYWDSLLPELTEQCDDLDDLGYQAKAYFLDNPYCPDEKTYRIDIQTKGNWPTDAHASLIYFTGSAEIRVSSNIRKLSEISLYATERGIRAVSNKEMTQMGVKELASYLLEGLVESIEKEKRSA